MDPFTRSVAISPRPAASMSSGQNLFRLCVRYRHAAVRDLRLALGGRSSWIGSTVQVSRAKVVGVIKTTKTRAGTPIQTARRWRRCGQPEALHLHAGEYVFDDPKLNQPWAGADAIRKKAWLYTLKRSGVRYRHLYQTRRTFATANIQPRLQPVLPRQSDGTQGPEMLFRHYGSYLAEYDGQTAKAPILIQNPTRKIKSLIVQFGKAAQSGGSNPQLHSNNVPRRNEED